VSIVRRAAIGLLVIALIAEALLLRAAIAQTFDEGHTFVFELWAIGGFICAVFFLAVSGLAGRVASRAVVGVGALFQLLMVTRPPVDSDDDFRYLWDAKVQLAGIDPYRYAPSSPALAHVRDNYLFPAGATCGQHAFSTGCTRLNLPDAHTIYPPVAEGMFTLVRVLSFGGHGQQLPLQLAAAIGVIAVSWLIAHHALAQGRPLWTVALWAWCPVAAIELANNAHIDWLGVLFGVLALTVARGRPILAGLLIGAGISTKLYPGLLGASFLRRRPIAVIMSAAVVVVLGYLPHVLAIGTGVFGYLPDYLQTGGYGNGQQYRLLSWALPHALVTPIAVLIVVAVIGWALLRTDPEHPERTALIVVGVAILVTTPTLPWYTLLLLALVALNGRPEWLGVVIAPTVEYLSVGAHGADLGHATTFAYAGGLLVVIAGVAVRRRAQRTAPRPLLPVG
jgi:alpha-1,2-mannosyltransferase